MFRLSLKKGFNMEIGNTQKTKKLFRFTSKKVS